jgi:hypothetical protein
MDKFLKDNGNRGKKMVMDYGVLRLEIVMKVIGSMVANKVKELILIKIAYTRDNFIIAWKMGKESKFFQMVINLKVNTKMDDQTVKESMSGLMEAIMKDSSKMDIDRA